MHNHVKILEKNQGNYLKGRGYEVSYNLKNVGNSQITSFFNNFTKYIFTDKVEIKKPAQLPVYLLHKTFNEPSRRATKAQFENEINK